MRKVLMASEEARFKLEGIEREAERYGTMAQELEEQLAQENQKSALAVARVADLLSEIEYLKGQVIIYQARMGLLPQEKRDEERADQKPLRTARVPFAVAQARIQTERTEAYWKQQADKTAALLEDGKTSDGASKVPD